MTLALEDSGEGDAAAFAQPWKHNSATALEIISMVPDLDPAQNQHTADADSTTVRVHLTNTAFAFAEPLLEQAQIRQVRPAHSSCELVLLLVLPH